MRQLVVYGGELYIVGRDITTASGLISSGIVKWNGNFFTNIDVSVPSKFLEDECWGGRFKRPRCSVVSPGDATLAVVNNALYVIDQSVVYELRRTGFVPVVAAPSIAGLWPKTRVDGSLTSFAGGTFMHISPAFNNFVYDEDNRVFGSFSFISSAGRTNMAWSMLAMMITAVLFVLL